MNTNMSSLRDFAKDLTAGGVAATLAKTVTAPVDRVKILLQTQHVNAALARPYSGPTDCVIRVYQEQGFVSFWRGNMANLLRYFPNHAMNFAFKDRYKNTFVGNATATNDFWRMFFGNLAAGGAAGGTSLFVGYPLDMARTRLAADVTNQGSKRKFAGTFACLVNIYRDNGILAIYRGFGVALLGVVTFKALFLGGYDIAKIILQVDEDNEKNKKGTIHIRLIAAQTVTTVVGTACYPLDTVRRRVMMLAKQKDGTHIYKSGWHCFQTIIREEGFRGLFKGLSANLVRGAGGSLLLVGYDEIKKVMSGL